MLTSIIIYVKWANYRKWTNYLEIRNVLHNYTRLIECHKLN